MPAGERDVPVDLVLGEDVTDKLPGLAGRVLAAGVQEQLAGVLGYHDAVTQPAPRVVRQLLPAQQLCGPPHIRLSLEDDPHSPVICHAAECTPATGPRQRVRGAPSTRPGARGHTVSARDHANSEGNRPSLLSRANDGFRPWPNTIRSLSATISFTVASSWIPRTKTPQSASSPSDIRARPG